MIEKYQNKYRIESARLQGFDYGSNGGYYVSICTKNRKHSFGEIEKPDVWHSTAIGEIAQKFWAEIPNHFPFVIIDEFVIMPDHIHGILFFDKPVLPIKSDVVETDNYPSLPKSNPQSNKSNPQSNKFGTQSQNLGSVIRGFKSSLRRYANKNNIEFEWQPRFYDHIIRDKDDYIRIVNYIKYNPKNWVRDKFFTGETII